MPSPLEFALGKLSEIQRKAVEWNDGALLVLAGPGAGKTRVLTCRVAHLLDRSPDERFRLLALTFTNKAAHEMSSRVSALAPRLEERADIHTFHSFCAQVLRQHGVHLDIRPDFAIYSKTSDREAVLEDALRRNARHFDRDDVRLLPMIDALKARLVSPKQAEKWVAERNSASSEEACRVAYAYRLYESELRSANALDFNSLIFEAYQLFGYPAMARHYQTVYRYWLLDEFQDTNGAQYELLRRMAGRNFHQLFAVADDDQTIYEWNGADVQRIGALVKHFACDVIQMPANFRCPPRIVEVANRLVVYNARRVASKSPTKSARSDCLLSYGEQVQCREFATDDEEVAGIASEIACLDRVARGKSAVLARTRALLEAVRAPLEAKQVPTTILMRRDDFVSPEMRWLVACLKQINRPLDRRNMVTLVGAFNNFSPASTDFDDLMSRSAVEGITYLKAWTAAVRQAGLPSPTAEIVNLMVGLAGGDLKPASAIDQILGHFESDEHSEDLKDDLSAWHQIRGAVGQKSLDKFLQELELRSKEPAPKPGAVSLATIHSAKGLEFDTVYLIGLAEEVLPSWHSIKRGNSSSALEEERRSCFVAITRTKQRLILSRAHRYKGWVKQPSRFLVEMGLLMP